MATYTFKSSSSLNSFLFFNEERSAQYVRDICDDLVVRTNQIEPPYDPNKYADFFGIVVRELDILEDGRIFHYGNKQIIILKKNSPITRKRFTCCHEIVHNFFSAMEERPFLRGKKQAKGAYSLSLIEENLCNLGATYLLMPHEKFKDIASQFKPSWENVKHLASKFIVSPETLAYHLIDTDSWHCSFARWQSVVLQSGDKGFRPISYRNSPTINMRFLPGMHVSYTSPIGRAFYKHRPLREHMKTGEVMEIIPIGENHVFSLVYFP